MHKQAKTMLGFYFWVVSFLIQVAGLITAIATSFVFWGIWSGVFLALAMYVLVCKIKDRPKLYHTSNQIAAILYWLFIPYGASTDIADNRSYGYGKLDYNGFWQYDLYFMENDHV
jgi:hypothetical protein